MRLVVISILFIFSFVSVAAQNADRFLQAAAIGNFKAVEKQLKKGIDINISGAGNNTALILAARGGHSELAEYLLNKKADVNRKNDYHYTALLYAVDNNDSDLVRMLLANEANVNELTVTGSTPLMQSVKTGNLEMLRLLHENNADINSWERAQGETALMWAIKGEHNEIAKYLIKNKAQVNANQDEGLTPLMFACMYDNYEIASLLIEQGADITARDFNGRNALIHLPNDGDLSIVKLVVGFDSEKPLIDLGSYTAYIAMTHAVRHGDIELLKYIMSNRQNKEVDYTTILILSSSFNQTDILSYLFEYYTVSINARGLERETALMAAAANGHHEVVEYLLSKGADIEIRLQDGKNALLMAVQGGHTKTTEIILNNGANPNASNRITATAPDKLTGTALIHASANGHDDIVRLLLGKNAEIDSRNEDGNTALLIALNFNHFEIALYLLRSGANPDIRNKLGFTPLMMASSKGNLALVELLISREAMINIVQKDRVFTALDVAYSGYYISRNLKDREGMKQYQEVIDFLKSKGAKTAREILKK